MHILGYNRRHRIFGLMCTFFLEQGIANPSPQESLHTFFESYTALPNTFSSIALNLFWTTGYQFAVNASNAPKDLPQRLPLVHCGGTQYGEKFFSTLSSFLSSAPSWIHVNFCLDYPTLISNQTQIQALEVYNNFTTQDFSTWKSNTVTKLKDLNLCSFPKDYEKIQAILDTGECFSPVIASDMFRILGALNGTKKTTWAYCDIDTFCEWTEKLFDLSLHTGHIFHHLFRDHSMIQKDTLTRLEGTNDFLVWHIKNFLTCTNFIKDFLNHIDDQVTLKETPQGYTLEYIPIDPQFLTYHITLAKEIRLLSRNFPKFRIASFNYIYNAFFDKRILRSNVKYLLRTTGPRKLHAIIENAKENSNNSPEIIEIPIEDELIVSGKSWVSALVSERILEDEFVLKLSLNKRIMLQNLMMALEDLRVIRGLLKWKNMMLQSDVEIWRRAKKYIRKYIQYFNIFSVDSLTHSLVSIYKDQRSEVQVISLENDDHEQITCKFLSPNHFVEKIKTELQTEGTLYRDFKNVCAMEKVPFSCFEETDFQRLREMCSTFQCSMLSSLKSRKGENVSVLSSKSRTIPGQKNQSDINSQFASAPVCITIDDD
jgi:hypothetical protein